MSTYNKKAPWSALCDCQVVSKYTEHDHDATDNNQALCPALVYARLWPDKTFGEWVLGNTVESDNEHN